MPSVFTRRGIFPATVLFALWLSIVPARGEQGATADVSRPEGQKVFVTGHSFHVPSARPFDQIARSAGIDGHTLSGIQGIGGSSVTKHWDLPDDRDKARKAIKAGEGDVLTVAPFHTPLPDPAIDKFTALLLEHNPKGRVVVQASWVPMDRPGNNPLTFENAQRDAADPSLFRTTWAPLMDKMRKQVELLNAEFIPKYGRP